MRIDNQPYGRLNEIIYEQTFTTHPYKHPTIGSMADLEAASVADVRDFYNTFYVPENATLTLVGDIDSAQALQLASQYLGRVPKAAQPVPRDIPKEPPQTAERRVTLQTPWPLPAVVVAYHITYDGNPDSYPLHIAGKVLSDGQSSRIYKKLVYDTALAVAAFGGPNLIEDPNLFYAVAIVSPGRTPAQAADALIAEFERLKNEPISERELQRAKNQFSRDYILGRESDEQKARQLSHAVVIHHDIKTADGEWDIFQSLKTERRAARRPHVFHDAEPHRADPDAIRKAAHTVMKTRTAGVIRVLGCCACVALVLVCRPCSVRSPWRGRRSFRRARCRRGT